mgnify:CR=1 FL=1
MDCLQQFPFEKLIPENSKQKHDHIAFGGELPEVFLNNIETDKNGIPSEIGMQHVHHHRISQLSGEVHNNMSKVLATNLRMSIVVRSPDVAASGGSQLFVQSGTRPTGKRS